jgi:hypothetical protein
MSLDHFLDHRGGLKLVNSSAEAAVEPLLSVDPSCHHGNQHHPRLGIHFSSPYYKISPSICSEKYYS